MRGPGLGLWLVRTLRISVFFLLAKLGDHRCWFKEGNGNTGRPRKSQRENWGREEKVDFSGVLLPPLRQGVGAGILT